MNIAILGAALAASAPLALADRLYGDLSTSGTATITATAITFGKINSTKTNPHYDQSKGAVIEQDSSNSLSFSNFDADAAMYYDTGATNTTQNAAHQYTGRTSAKYTFPVTLGTTLATPVLLYTIDESGVTLDLYLTRINTVTVGAAAYNTGSGASLVHHAATTGSFTALAYVTLTGHSGVTHGTFTLTNNGTGSGQNTFSAKFLAPAPEPGTLALLGTGMLGTAGMMFRRRRSA